MALETATYINGLVSTNPTASDNISQGDDHIRLLKSTIKATFPNIAAAVTVTQDDLNAMPDNLASIFAIADDLQDQVDTKAPLASPSFTGNVTITDTDAGGAAAPILTLLRDSASPAANDVLGQLRFNGKDSLGNSTIFGAVDSILIDPTNTSEDSVLRFRNMSAGTLSEAMRIDESNRMLIGTTSYLDGWSSGQNLVLAGNTAAGLSVHAGNNLGVLGFARSGGTAGAATAVTNGDTIAAINFAAADGINTRINAARIAVGVDGAPGTNDMPGRIVFSTTPDGSSTLAERLRINNAGALGLGGANFGTSGQYLKSNGSAAAPEWADATGGVITPNVQTFNASGTWNKPAGTWNFYKVEIWGGGGSGAKSNPGGGGGGGGYWAFEGFASDFGSTSTVTIGAGGASQTTTGTDGNNGGTSSVTLTAVSKTLSVFGGGGGLERQSGGGGGSITGVGGTFTNLTVAGGADAGEGGAGQTTTTGNALSVGGSGTTGGAGGGSGTRDSGGSARAGGNSAFGGAGGGAGAVDSSPGPSAGGTSIFGGNGGAGAFDANNATAGSQPGGGGGGSETGNSGAGGAGRVIITLY